MNYLFLTLLAVLALLLLRCGERIVRLYALRPGDPGGTFVAEVWLEWPICRGSTLFRAAYASEKRAVDAVRLHAKWLDLVLPTHYWASHRDGTRYRETHDFGIQFGVRSRTAWEGEHGVTNIWSPSLPGTSAFKGEPLSSTLAPSPGVSTLEAAER